ncbi:hypothetical protein EYF80_045465 [Liparis tanakae]|uniref:Uncharacterized protein n=1 Tax=Liparis tanakae TaxID=230148 RepID=A0A4Z2FU92_9TELE|nr:hypothetical protein EYF80_045465 [Liparis tanakae]
MSADGILTFRASTQRKDMIGRQEVPAEHLIGQRQVALEDRRHLGVEVLPAAELLQHLHGQHEDLTQAVLLEEKGEESTEGAGQGGHTRCNEEVEEEQTWKRRLQLPWNSMLRPMLLVLLELENSLSRAVRMEHARVCCGGGGVTGAEVTQGGVTWVWNQKTIEHCHLVEERRRLGLEVSGPGGLLTTVGFRPSGRHVGGLWTWWSMDLEVAGPGGLRNWRSLDLEVSGPGGLRNWRSLDLEVSSPLWGSRCR